MVKVRITAVYEYEIGNPEFYPDCKNDEERMLLDKSNVKDSGIERIYLEEIAELKSTNWEIVKE